MFRNEKSTNTANVYGRVRCKFYIIEEKTIVNVIFLYIEFVWNIAVSDRRIIVILSVHVPQSIIGVRYHG